MRLTHKNLPKDKYALYLLTTLDDAADTNFETKLLSAERLALTNTAISARGSTPKN